MGFRSQVARSTLADANESRDWRIYADFAQVLIRIARPLYARDPIGVDLDLAVTDISDKSGLATKEDIAELRVEMTGQPNAANSAESF